MQAPPGWYPDTADTTRLRWWDGATWTGNVHQQALPQPVPGTPNGRRTNAGKFQVGIALFAVFAGLRVLLQFATDPGATAVILAVTVVVLVPTLLGIKASRRRIVARSTVAHGALWCAGGTAEPPNLGYGQSGRSFFAMYRRSYWRARRVGTVALHVGYLVFESRRDRSRDAQEPAWALTPAQVQSISAARWGFGGIVEVVLVDGTKRRFSLSDAPPRDLDAQFARVGFPVG
jgi:hypothetical protein